MDKLANLIHIGRIALKKPAGHYLLLRKKGSNQYTWHEGLEQEMETGLSGITLADALEKAGRHWKDEGFRFVNCGFRYTLPERDEHGLNALFWQMVASYNSPNGVYFDEEIGCNCIVQNASEEARYLWKQLKLRTDEKK